MIAKQQPSKGELRTLKEKLAALPDDLVHVRERNLLLRQILALIRKEKAD